MKMLSGHQDPNLSPHLRCTETDVAEICLDSTADQSASVCEDVPSAACTQTTTNSGPWCNDFTAFSAGPYEEVLSSRFTSDELNPFTFTSDADITTSGGEYSYGLDGDFNSDIYWNSEFFDNVDDIVPGAHVTINLQGTYTLCQAGFTKRLGSYAQRLAGCRGRILMDDVLVATWDETEIQGEYVVPFTAPVTGSIIRFDFDVLCLEEEVSGYLGTGYRISARDVKAWTCDFNCKNFDGTTHEETLCDTCRACFEHGCGYMDDTEHAPSPPPPSPPFSNTCPSPAPAQRSRSDGTHPAPA